eukprot:CAMPEP_0194220816 /NCGR_PEP_ID=MMETSP0156-20130528/29280_1 /TAXON_ID=33649 /ORGANISM="Thalassionema nitzschioides, Strain L26-B" /LENGTH=80 /DNA_ID=CAMNT_0038951015 /DNA_START=515 /DNA_END=757 /DNA_ORIENTATION=+
MDLCRMTKKRAIMSIPSSISEALLRKNGHLILMESAYNVSKRLAVHSSSADAPSGVVTTTGAVAAAVDDPSAVAGCSSNS